MRIVNLETFRSLPNGTTVFCKYQPQIFEDLQIKEDTWDVDFISTPLIGQIDASGSGEHTDILFRIEKTGEDIPFSFEETGRDGCFEKDQLFAIFSEADVKGLADRLLKTLEK